MKPQSLYLPLYFLGAVLMIVPGFESILSVLPITPSALNWRFGAAGLLSAGLLTPALGLMIIAITAILMDHRRTLRTVAIFGIMLAVCLVLALGTLSLDAIQMRARVPAQGKQSFTMAAALAFVRIASWAAYMIAFALATWRASRPGSRSDDKGAKLVARTAATGARV